MKIRFGWVFFLFAVPAVDLLQDSSSVAHRRSRRYIVFPEGSTFNMAFCLTLKALTGGDNIFTEGVNWVMSYDLPNETIHDNKNRFEFPVIMRRHKRDLYVRMEKLMDSAGISGRECVLNTICETGQQLAPRQGILEEVLRVLFAHANVDRSRGVYHEAYQRGSNNENCNDLYPCPVNFLQLALGFGEFGHPSSP